MYLLSHYYESSIIQLLNKSGSEWFASEEFELDFSNVHKFKTDLSDRIICDSINGFVWFEKINANL
jgi:hypothetical protein